MLSPYGIKTDATPAKTESSTWIRIIFAYMENYDSNGVTKEEGIWRWAIGAEAARFTVNFY